MTGSLEILVEEPSAKAALDVLAPRLAPGWPVKVHAFNGKSDLLGKLGQRLRGYSSWPTPPLVVVLVDRDADDCVQLKQQLVKATREAGLRPHSRGGRGGSVLLRVAIEELEAWFLGDVPALCAAYPGVPGSVGTRAGLRDPDAIAGGTWEALERVLIKAGHHRGGLAKIRAATDIARHMDLDRNRSASFREFAHGVRSLIEHHEQMEH